MAGRNKHVVKDIISLPRRKDVISCRKAVDNNVGNLFGIEEFLTGEFPRATCDILAVCAGQIYSSIAHGYHLDFSKKIPFKVSFDGSNAGKKDMLAFGIIPLWDVKYVQVNTAVFPISVGFTSESKDSLEQCLPLLKESISYLNENGLMIYGPGQENLVHCDTSIDIAADLSSLWKLCGIGSAANTCSCLFCYNTKPGREDIGCDVSDLSRANKWRTDLVNIFGVPWRNIHICTLHGHTRISEKLLKLLAVACVNNTKVLEVQLAKLKVEKKQAEAEVKRLNQSIKLQKVRSKASTTMHADSSNLER